MSILSPAIKQYFKIRNSLIDNFVLNPIGTQQQVFNELIGSGQYTFFGKKYDFQHIDNIADFQEHVPIHEYDDLKPYIERILNGEQNILWSSPITWFAKSSGTTSDKSKFIPVSMETLEENHYKSGKDVLALYLKTHPNSKITQGKCLAIGGSNQINQLTEESYFGDLSAVMLQNMPFVGQIMKAPELRISLMEDWEQKIRATIDTVQQDNITYMAGVPTWLLVMLKQLMQEQNINDLHQLWPNLELYIHGGVSFTPYKEQFQALTKQPINFMETYNASEGFFAAQDDLEKEGMLLFLNHGIFFEFMPVSEYGKKHPKTVTLKDVNTTTNYALIISNNSGLWRYLVGDTVQFTSLDPFRIKVTGRIKHFINAFGEEVIIENSDDAISFAAKSCNVTVNEYTAAPIYMSADGNGAHEWIIEFDKAPSDLNKFTDYLDQRLKAINSDYEAKRYHDIALRKPIVHIMQKGGFNEWLKSKGKLGGQHKVPRLCNTRVHLDEIIKYIK